MSNRKFNASGMGAQPVLNDAQIYNGPVQRGGAQTDVPVFGGTDEAHPGELAAGMVVRETPTNHQGPDGKVARVAKQPDGSVSST